VRRLVGKVRKVEKDVRVFCVWNDFSAVLN
jgi:hypothetical protein